MIWVRVDTKDYYRVIKKLKGIDILDIEYKDNKLYLYIKEEDYKLLNKYLITYDIEIVKRTGFKKYKDILKKNYIFIISIIIGGLVFLVVNNLIVRIDILHNDEEIRTILKEELDNYGIRVLSFKKSYDELNTIKNEILDKYPERLDWLEFEVVGMKLTVHVEERIITDISKDSKVCDVVATKRGMISSITATSGEVVVALNDYVEEGDTLITGIITYNEEIKDYTCATGEVKALTWYTVHLSLPNTLDTDEETGKVRYNIVWEYDNKNKSIFRNRLESYNSTYKTILKVFDFNLYLEKQIEVEKNAITLSEDELVKLALDKAKEALYTKINQNITINSQKVLQKTLNNSKMDIDVFMEVEETISTQKIIELEDVKNDVLEHD